MTEWAAVCLECGQLDDGHDEHYDALDVGVQHRVEYGHDVNIEEAGT